MMRSRLNACFGTLLLVLGVFGVSHAQFQPASKEELAMTSDPKAPGAPAVYLLREETDDDPHAFRSIYGRIKVLTEEGKQAATIHIRYPHTFVYNAMGNNSSRMASGNANHWDTPNINHLGEDQPWDTDSYEGKVQIAALEARVIQPDGSILPVTDKSEELLKTVVGSDREKETTFTIPGVQVGSIIEYRYQVRYDRFLAAPDWEIEAPYFTEKVHFVVRPANQFLAHTHEGVGVSDSQLKDSHDNILTDLRTSTTLPAGKSLVRLATGEYVLDLTDLPASTQDAYGPVGGPYHASFFYTYTPDQKDYWQKEMGFWNKKLSDYIAPTPELQSALKDLIAPSDTPLVKARKIYDFVQKIENIDFNSDGWVLAGSEWIPQGRVSGVLTAKKGTSNQIAYLYLALARSAGLTARPERIASRSHRMFNSGFQDNQQLDSVVIALDIDGTEHVVDPGTKLAPFETLHWAHSGAGGVALGANGKVETIITPLQRNSDNATLRVGSLTVGSQGGVSGTLKIAFLGQEALQLRQLALRSGPDAAKAEIDREVAGQVPTGVHATVDHLTYLDDPNRQLLAIVQVSGSLAEPAAGRLTLPRLFFGTREQNPFPAQRDSELPVHMPYPAQEQEQITYVLPAGFVVEPKPQDASLNMQEDATYQVRSKVETNSITNARVLARGFTFLEGQKYASLHDFYQKVIEADRQNLVLSPAAGQKAAQ